MWKVIRRLHTGAKYKCTAKRPDLSGRERDTLGKSLEDLRAISEIRAEAPIDRLWQVVIAETFQGAVGIP